MKSAILIVINISVIYNISFILVIYSMRICMYINISFPKFVDKLSYFMHFFYIAHTQHTSLHNGYDIRVRIDV